MTGNDFYVKGASIRLKTSELDETGDGIRFSVVIEKSAYETLLDEETGKLREEVKTGTLLLPTELLNGEALTMETANVSDVPTSGYWREITIGESVYMESLVYLWGIPSQYYEKEISAAGYIQSGESAPIYTETKSRSISYVAVAAVNDRPELKEQLAEYLPDCEVRFSDANGNEITGISGRTLKYGESLDEASCPVPSGYAGWYADRACTEKYDFSAEVTEPVSLYARQCVFAEDFEKIENNQGDCLTISPSGSTVTVTSEADEIPSEGSGAAIKINGTSDWPGVSLRPRALPTAGKAYSLTAKVRLLSDVIENGSLQIWANVYYKDTAESASQVLAQKFEWFSADNRERILTNTFTLPEAFADMEIRIFAIKGSNGDIVFSVDDVTITETPEIKIIRRPAGDMIFLEDSLKLETDYNVAAEVFWASSNTSVAEIGNDGFLTLKTTGKTTITANMNYNGKEYADSFVLTVVQTGIEVIDAPETLKVGEKTEVGFKVIGTIEGTLNAESSDPSVMTVELNEENRTLVLTGVEIGKATITVSKGSYEKSFAVTVPSPYTTTENFEMFTSEGYDTNKWAQRYAGGNSTLWSSNNAILSQTEDAELLPEGCGGKALLVSREKGADYSWPGVETVFNKKLTVGATYEFSVTVKAISGVSSIAMKIAGKDVGNSGPLGDGQTITITKTYTVGVEQPAILLFFSSSSANGYEGFTVDNIQVTELEQLIVTNRPKDDTLVEQSGDYLLGYEFLGGAAADSVVWTSSNVSMAAIDQTGKVTPLSAGNATITVTAGKYSYSFTLTVKEAS